MSGPEGRRGHGSGARQARPRLTPDDVVAAAEAIVDRIGWDQLTMTALAAELDVRVPSLYHHVRSLDALKATIQVRTMAQLGAELRRAAMGRSGDDGLRALAEALRSFARRHPRRYEAATRAPVDRDAFVAAALEANEALMAVVSSYGLRGEGALYAEAAAFAALHGLVSLEVSGFFGDEVAYDRLFSLVLAGVTATVSGQASPIGTAGPLGSVGQGEPCTTW